MSQPEVLPVNDTLRLRLITELAGGRLSSDKFCANATLWQIIFLDYSP
ncbi:hypothetical protein JXQ70_20925 [bacterium]|nr:hypothetical protein [bacterium]